MQTLILDRSNITRAHAGMYSCIIRDEFGDVESGATCLTVSECAKWFEEQGIRFYGNSAVIMRSYDEGNIIAKYTYNRPA